ncbi:MAG: glutamate racemase [Verrucomicrobiales bacterium]
MPPRWNRLRNRIAQQQAIGILDSGLGGLSVLREIHALLPAEDLLYIADSAWCPYGRRSFEEIRARTAELTDFLIDHGAKAIVIACNSATIAAIESLRASYPLPFVGMEPAVKPAAQLSRKGAIGVLATEASLAGERFHRLVNDHSRGIRVITRPCPEFVDLVEAGVLDGPEAEGVVREVLVPLLAEGVDVLVLGCSHYPFLRSLIEQTAGPDVRVIDTGAPVANRLKSLLSTDGMLRVNPGQTGEIQIRTTGDFELLQRLFPKLCPGIEATYSTLY